MEATKWDRNPKWLIEPPHSVAREIGGRHAGYWLATW
jgi:hypothetical protein